MYVYIHIWCGKDGGNVIETKRRVLSKNIKLPPPPPHHTHARKDKNIFKKGAPRLPPLPARNKRRAAAHDDDCCCRRTGEPPPVPIPSKGRCSLSGETDDDRGGHRLCCLSGEREKADRGEAGVERVDGACGGCGGWLGGRRRGEASSVAAEGGRDWAVAPVLALLGMGTGVEARGGCCRWNSSRWHRRCRDAQRCWRRAWLALSAASSSSGSFEMFSCCCCSCIWLCVLGCVCGSVCMGFMRTTPDTTHNKQPYKQYKHTRSPHPPRRTASPRARFPLHAATRAGLPHPHPTRSAAAKGARGTGAGWIA